MIDIRKQIYYEDNVIEREQARLVDNPNISDTNKNLILKFKDFCLAVGNSKHRISLVIRHLRMFAEYMGNDFDKAKREDIEKGIAKLNMTDYSDWTKVGTKKILKRFYRWLYKKDDTDALPDIVRWIKCPQPANKLKKEDLLTKAEIEKMISGTSQLMYKALISVLYESAIRPGELLQMRISDIKFEENYVCVYVRGKMEKKMGDRKVYLIQSYDLLLKWIQNHPFKDTPEHPVWIVSTRQVYKKKGLYGKAISCSYLNALLKVCAKRAGIKKRVFAYLFRHSRGTQLYIELGESMAKKMMGHAVDSDMAKVYNHMNEEDVLEKLKQVHGIKEEKKKEKPNTCYRCSFPNPYGAVICNRCGLSLNLKTAMQVERDKAEMTEKLELMTQIFDSLQQHPEILQLIQNPEFIEQHAELRAQKMFQRWKSKMV